MTMPLLNSTCHNAGLMYTVFGGGSRGIGVKYSSTGGRTVTVNEHCAFWPQLSDAEALTVVVPIGNVLPLGGVAPTPTGGQPPVVLTVENTTAPPGEVAVTVMFDGQVIVNVAFVGGG